MRFFSEKGQASIEAAVLLPALFALFALLLQPAILLYNNCIMNAAAAEGCRLLATNTASDASVRAYVERRLKAIPNLSIFHRGNDWEITWDAGANGANLQIVNHAEPLPLFGLTASFTKSMDPHGKIEQRVEASCSPVPEWVAAQGYEPATWISEWQ